MSKKKERIVELTEDEFDAYMGIVDNAVKIIRKKKEKQKR